MEARLAPKPVWKTDKMPVDLIEKMMRQIVPVAMEVDLVEGTWKMSQNKAGDVRKNAAEALNANGFGMNWQWIAEKMKNSPT